MTAKTKAGLGTGLVSIVLLIIIIGFLVDPETSFMVLTSLMCLAIVAGFLSGIYVWLYDCFSAKEIKEKKISIKYRDE